VREDVEAAVVERVGALELLRLTPIRLDLRRDSLAPTHDDLLGPLLVTEEATENLYLSARNLRYVEVRDVQGLDPVALVGADTVVITSDAVKKIEEWLA
jgi:hypothetical protein